MSTATSKSFAVFVLAFSIGSLIASAVELPPKSAGPAFCAPQPKVPDQYTPVDPAQVRLTGWLGRYVDEVRDDFVLPTNIVPMYLEPLQRRGDIAWRSEHIGKWLDTASSLWRYTGDPRIRQVMDQALAGMLQMQDTNGWLGSYDEPYRFYQIDWNALSRPAAWPYYYGWDLWCNFMSLEGLVHYHWAMPEDLRALGAAERIGGLIADTFGHGKQDIGLIPHDNGVGGMTPLLGAIHLYELTGEERFLEFCRYVVCQFGRTNSMPILLAGSRGPEIDRFPFLKEGAVVKHAETELILNGLCELYRMTGESSFLDTCRNVYEGGYAPLLETMCLAGYLQAHTNAPAPATVRPRVETCDIPPMLRWWVEMFRLTGEPKYLNAVERQVYNQLLAHRTLHGVEFAYMPSQHFDSPSGCVRRYGTLEPFDCCWSMGPVGIADLPRWSYFTCPGGILVNFFEPSTFTTKINGVEVKVNQRTEYPIRGRVDLMIDPQRPLDFELKVRFPEWVGRGSGPARNNTERAPLIRINGKKWNEPARPGTLISLKRKWKKRDRVTMEFPMSAWTHSPMDSAPGYCVIERGPLVLAMSRRFNDTGDGWSYVSPICSSNRALELQPVSLDDPAGQAKIGWKTLGIAHWDVSSRIVCSNTPVTLVPFSDAGTSTDPYVAAFPLPGTLNSLPPRLEPKSLAKRIPNRMAIADSENNECSSASKAVDGDRTTAWQSAGTAGAHWIDVRFEGFRSVDTLVLRFGDRRNHPVDFRLQAGRDLKEILSVHDCNLADYFYAQFKGVRTDVIRLVIDASSGDAPGAAISEIEFWEH